MIRNITIVVGFFLVLGASAPAPSPAGDNACSDGTSRWEGHLVDGRRDGLWRTMQVAVEGPTTRCVCPESEGRYERGVEVGRWTFYSRYVDADIAERRANLCARYGACDGDRGCTSSTATFTFDERLGLQRSSYASGSRRSEGRFVGGLREGEHTTWFPSGRVQRRGHYVHGLAVGTWEVGVDDSRPLVHVEQESAHRLSVASN